MTNLTKATANNQHTSFLSFLFYHFGIDINQCTTVAIDIFCNWNETNRISQCLSETVRCFHKGPSPRHVQLPPLDSLAKGAENTVFGQWKPDWLLKQVFNQTHRSSISTKARPCHNIHQSDNLTHDLNPHMLPSNEFLGLLFFLSSQFRSENEIYRQIITRNQYYSTPTKSPLPFTYSRHAKAG